MPETPKDHSLFYAGFRFAWSSTNQQWEAPSTGAPVTMTDKKMQSIWDQGKAFLDAPEEKLPESLEDAS